MAISVAIITITVVELGWRPRFDWTEEKNLLIWYNKNSKRTYIKLF